MEHIQTNGTMLLKATTKFVVANRVSLFVASQHTVQSAATRALNSRSMRAANSCGDKFDIYTVAQWEYICARSGMKVRIG